MERYNHKEIEQKWRENWNRENIFKTKDKGERMYILVEFPYPSGNLHVGHWYAFSVTDMYARYQIMKGKDVLFPIGFDAFGLPAENAAIKHNLNPRDWTYSNMEFMKKQLKLMGASFDWSREVVTCDPKYYKHTQWLFTKLFENDLAYQAETLVNWCPSCKTVLANEQVNNGHCDRCDNEVVRKNLKQWMLRISNYADRLIDDLDKVNLSNAIKQAQKEWIGRSHGANIDFEIKGKGKLKVFTTRPDTIYGVTYLVVAPEHDILKEIDEPDVVQYIQESSKKSEMDRIKDVNLKTGVRVNGLVGINPANNEEIPVYVADYVLNHYGTGAIMAVPAHDERDLEFAKKFDLPVKEVVDSDNKLINSEEFNGRDSSDVKEDIVKKVNGEIKTTFKLRDWLVSRQRYWGCPIPIIHCKECGPVAVPEKDLPINLPELQDYLPEDSGKSPLAKNREWVEVSCPSCGEDAQRETDTLDTFIDSSWYFLRYTDPNNEETFANKEKMDKWMPVDFYSGGAEHTTMHLLYARFFQKALFDLGLVNQDEPFKERLNRSLILGPDGNKMSKSKGNVIDPDEIVERLGADTVRSYLAFIGPYNELGHYPWDPNGVVGVRRFLERINKITEFKEESSEEVKKLLHKTIKKVGDDFKELKFNTAISALMIFLNLFEKQGISKEDFKTFIQLLSPIAPHLSEEIWQRLGGDNFVSLSTWPQFDESLIEDKIISITISVNGKVRGSIDVSRGTSEKEILEMIYDNESVSKWIKGKEIKKTFYVENKLINFVL